mgnify:FL=1|tara:strand:- start:18003 stop:18218 length:216 start_codon:yes stop_codon:yes gene_type:complete
MKGRDFEEGEWYCEARMGIWETRTMYKMIEKYLSTCEDTIDGKERQYLEHVRNKMFSMIAEYTFTEVDRTE